jgi:hypothetical protein
MRVGFVTRFTELLQLETTNNYNAFANLHTLQIITAHIQSSQFTVTSYTLPSLLPGSTAPTLTGW